MLVLLAMLAAAPVPAPVPFQPRVEDPLLVPAKRPELEIATWEQAITLLRTTSTDARIAEAAVARAEGRWRQSLGLLLPNVRLSASVLYDLLNPDVPPIAGGSAIAGSSGKKPTIPTGTLNANLSQSVVDVSAWRGLDSADAAKRSAVASERDVHRRLTQALARTLVAVVAAERVAELNRLGLRQALERAALTQRTKELGATTEIDVVRVEQDVEVARGALIAGDEQLVRTREALGLALGSPAEVGVKPGFALDGLLGEAQLRCKEIEWAERPDLEAARTSVESAAEARRQASAGYLPTLGVNSSLFGYTSDPGPGRFSTWSIGAVLSVPIWEGGTREGLVGERRAAERQAAETLEAARRQVALDVARSRRGVSVASALVATASTARAKAAQLDLMTRRSFEVGRGSSLELVQSAAALRQADVALATREYELVQARLDAFLTEASCDW